MTDQASFEIPATVRELAERNVQQARAAYAQFIDAARKAQEVAAKSSDAMAAGAREVQAKALGYAESNVDASFAFATDLARARDVKELMAIQQRYAAKQAQTYAKQAQELGRLMADAAKTRRSGLLRRHPAGSQVPVRHMPRMRAARSTVVVVRRGSPAARCGRRAPGPQLEVLCDGCRDEARARGIDVAVAALCLVVHVEALRHHQHQRVLGARHGDVEQPPLLLDLLGAAGRHVRGDAAVDDVEDVDRLPFLTLGGVDGRQDQVVLVEQRRAGLRARRARRIEREVGEERFARGIARSDAHELVEIAGAHDRVRVALLEMGLIPLPHEVELRRPAGLRAVQPLHQLDRDRARHRRPWRAGGTSPAHRSRNVRPWRRAPWRRWRGRDRAAAARRGSR